METISGGERVIRVLQAALQAVDPGMAIRHALVRQGDTLHLAGETIDLRRFRRVFLIGFGKAGFPMAVAASDILGDSLTSGLIVVKDALPIGDENQSWNSLSTSRIRFLMGSHPIPDEFSLNAGQEMMTFLQTCQEDDLIICLISGGGSALVSVPVLGVSLANLQTLTSLLLSCGAGIQEINTLRKHLDLVKGGGLARRVYPAQLFTLILSDVVGDTLDVIASGPTTPDSTSYQDAWDVLSRYSLLEKIPSSIRDHLDAGRFGRLTETPKPGDVLFKNVRNSLVGSGFLAARAALIQAGLEGFQGLLLTTSLEGEARQIGRFLASIARQVSQSGDPLPRPACLVSSGETTVTISGTGLGGRNQELALGAVAALAGLKNTILIALATDGGDGPTDAAGAVVTGETLSRAQKLGLDPFDFLQRNDSYHFFEPLGDLLRPGPTLTNVNDLSLIFLS